MNKLLVIRILSVILLIEAACLLPPLGVALGYGDGDAPAIAISFLLLAVIGGCGYLLARPKETNLRAREGFFVVASSWVLMSLFGALPYRISGMIPNYIDAVFEAVSGITTTGATIITEFDGLPRGLMMWRSITHWIGGMGVLVLTLALIPKLTGRTSHLVRAESPGPSLSKIVPKMGDSAKILYTIYLVLTALEFVSLWIAGLSPYDAVMHALSNAGNGGFSNYGASVGAFNNPAAEIIITVFMFLFGINFALYYQCWLRHLKEAVRSEELHWYAGIVLSFSVIIALFLIPQYGSFWTALRYSAFQVNSYISTTGFATADVNTWPQAAQMMMMTVMIIGGCAGSTAGGMKVIRIAVLAKLGRRETFHTFQPRKVQAIRFEGKPVDDTILSQISVFAAVYFAMIVIGGILISLENRYNIATNLTASLTCVSNVGPVLTAAAGLDSMAGYGSFAKIIMCLLMLAGRLELFPMLALFHPAIWKKR